jgi:phytoene desaturase
MVTAVAAAPGPFRATGRPATAVVIGSGFGGLAAAIRLAVRGYRVTVLEKLDGPGGRAYVHRQDGFTFDAGPTIVTAPFLFEELWTLCGRRMADDVQLRALDPFYRIRFEDGSWFDYSGDDAAMRAQVAKFSPDDLRGWDGLLAESERCYELGFADLSAKAFNSLRDLFAAMPSMLRMRAWRTIHAMVSTHLRDDRLRTVMSFHPLLIGGNPFAVTCVYSLIHALERKFGVHWAMGGTGALVSGMVKLLEGAGGRLRCNAEVARIKVEEGRATGVRLASGEFLPADIVVSNGDAMWTYRHLVEAKHRRHWTDRRIDRGRYSMSLFVWYFGTRRRYEDVPHHMILMGPRYRGLLQDIFENKVLTPDFSMYLHRPTATDASMAPPGCDAFYALVPVPHLDSGTDWRARTASYRDEVAAALERTVLPGLREHIVTERITTPQDFYDRLLSLKGAAFGLEPRLTQSAWFRPHNRSEDIAGLYMVGAGVHPGAGMPGVLSSAKALDAVVPDARVFA